MNKYEILAEKLKNREKVIGTTMALIRSPFLLEKMNRDDLDFILFDGEHGVFDVQSSIEMFQICRLMGLPCFLRAQDAEYHLIAKAIDMGADGIMLPRTESLEQLRTAVDALLFAPDGRKGMGIGLSICKTIISAHGGTIYAANHEHGAEFYFSLPKEVKKNDS